METKETPKLRYSLGLDIGSESVGWAVIELDENDQPIGLVDMGVRAFDAVRQEQQKATTPAQERRLARSQRRRLRNKKKRKKKLIETSIRYGLVKDKEEAESFLMTLPGDKSPWDLRVEGLDRKLDRREWFRILYHLVNHRGFKSIKRGEDSERSNSDDVRKMKAAANKLSSEWRSKGYRTVAEFLCKDHDWISKNGFRKRNKDGSYELTVLRDDLIEEAKLLFKQQRKFSNEFATSDFEKEYIDILDEKPRLLEGEELKAKVGYCTFETEERRAPKATFTAQKFRALQIINNLRFINPETGEIKESLTPDEIKKVFALSLKRKEVKPEQILKELDLQGWLIEGYDRNNEKIIVLEDFHKLKKALEREFPDTWERLLADTEFYDEIASVLTYYLTPESARRELKKLQLEDDVVDALLNVSFKGHASLSLKALKKIIPYLEQGYKYSQACELAGYDHRALPGKNRKNHIPPFESEEFDKQLKTEYLGITNPNVKRALAQARKVVNAIVRLYGVPSRIGIELAREMTLSRSEKIEQARLNNERRQERENIIRKLKEEHHIDNPNKKLIDKYLLYELQGGKCAYSLKEIDLNRMLHDPSYVEIDHIIPRSLSFNDSFSNKVLVLASENRNKGDRLAAEYIKNTYGEEHFNKCLALIRDSIKNAPNHRAGELWSKEKLFRKEELSEEELVRFRERYLTNTRHAARYFKKVLCAYLDIEDSKVITVNGRMTRDLRHLLGVEELKKDRLSDKHHAVDAAVCALCDYATVFKLSNFYKNKDGFYEIDDGTLINQIGQRLKLENIAWPDFRKDIIKRFDTLIVSRAPNRKVTGRGHQDTIYSLKHVRKVVNLPEQGKISINKDAPRPTTRIRLDSLSPQQIKKILECPKEILVDYDSNYLLYERIINRLKETEPAEGSKNKWAAIAFGPGAEPIHVPSKDGKEGPIVRKIKIFTDVFSGVAVRGGIAPYDNIVRLDFYRRKERNGKYKYYVVPVYAADIAMGIVPDRVATINKPESEWKKLDDSFEFIFHVFNGDCLRIYKKLNEDPIDLYVTSFDRGALKVIGNYLDRSNKDSQGKMVPVRVSFTNAAKIQKLYVDILGRVSVIEKEKKVF